MSVTVPYLLNSSRHVTGQCEITREGTKIQPQQGWDFSHVPNFEPLQDSICLK